MYSANGFLLTRQWRDMPNGLVLKFWLHTETGPLLIEQQNEEGVFFVERNHTDQATTLIGHLAQRHRALPLHSFKHQPVTAYYFRSQQALRSASRILNDHNIQALEDDVRTIDRYLMERFLHAGIAATSKTVEAKAKHTLAINAQLSPINFQPKLKIVSFDIETSMTADQLYSIAVYGHEEQLVFMIGEEPLPNAEVYTNERSMLKAFLSWIEHYDPDVLIGWNCINFDLRVLANACKRLNLRFELGRDREEIEWRQHPENPNHYFVLVPGRSVIDGIDMLKMATYHYESFALEHVAQKLLGTGKLIHDNNNRGAEITTLFENDKPALADYNLEDCALVWRIFEKTKLIDFAIERARMTGLPLDKIGGSVAAFENLYLPKLHRQGYVAPNLPVNPQGVGSPGGYVMSSKPGLYENVLVLDFKSLYPSIIRTFLIDPYSLVEGEKLSRDIKSNSQYDISILAKGFRGAYFKKANSILPGLIETLWKSRDVAKSSNNQALSQAIKIIMNSFYGVMGTPGCRFFDPRLPSSITLRGHEIMNQTRQLIEQLGYDVIYGDTDSIFVWLNQDVSLDKADLIGTHISTYVTEWWRDHLTAKFKLDSALELEYENHYSKFVMPTIRGSDQGTKKRYAGLVYERNPDEETLNAPSYQLVFKGLENVRTDWTKIAREFQKALYEKVFTGEPYLAYIQNLISELKRGMHDDKLVFRKRLRRKLNEYQRNVPPHVQAAIKADRYLTAHNLPPRYTSGGWIEYVYTVNGPEPLEHNPSQLDYELYLERQIEPIVDGILSFLGTSYKDITNQQIKLI